MIKNKGGIIITLEKILSRADDLPVLPHIAMEILRLVEDQNSSTRDFEAIIENDPVFTLRILKLANSAYYGYPRTIMSIKESIVILGLDTLKSLVLSLITRQMLSHELENYGLKRGELWEHSLVVAMLARSIAKMMKYSNAEKLFVAGLLHDVGKLALDFYLHEDFEALKYQINEAKMTFTQAEERLTGYDHAVVGAALIEYWNLPNFLVDVVKMHHQSDIADENIKKDAQIIDVADRLSYKIARGSGTIFEVDKTVDNKELESMNIDQDKLNEILDSIKQSVQMFK